MKKLCFGSFATILNLCKAQSTSQKLLVGTILLTVAPEYDIRDDDTTVSNLIHCKRNLSPNITDMIQTINPRSINEDFKRLVLPLLDENKKALIILALKALINEDSSIEPNTNVERLNGLTKESIIAKDSFVFADFLTGIFIYTLSINNHNGSDNVKGLNDDYIQSLYPHRNEIGFISAYTNFNIETAVEITPDPHLIALLTETGGKCHRCKRPLASSKNGHNIYYGKVVRLLETEDVVLCVNCDREIQVAPDSEKLSLLESKRELENRMLALESISHITLEKQIEKVLREIDEVEDTGNLGLKNEPVKVENKITEPRLRDKTIFHVTRLYEAVNDALDRISGENKLDIDKFAKNIRRIYEDASETISSQSEVYNFLVNWLYEKAGYKYKEACEIIISYFVQRCEVFDEITK